MSVRRFEQCVYGYEGDEILAKYGDMTPSLNFVPTVTFNGVSWKINFTLKNLFCPFNLMHPSKE